MAVEQGNEPPPEEIPKETRRDRQLSALNYPTIEMEMIGPFVLYITAPRSRRSIILDKLNIAAKIRELRRNIEKEEKKKETTD